MSVCRQISIVASPNPPSADEAMADAKRARIEVQSFTQVRVEDLRVKGLDKDSGAPIVVVSGLTPFNLTPSGWLSTRYGFDLNGKYGKPSFLSGEKSEKKSESLAVRISLDAATAVFLKQLDEKASEEHKKIRDASWNPLVTEDALFNGGSSVKVHVALTGSALTKLTVVEGTKIDRGEGWAFLQEKLESGNFYNADVKVCLRVRSIWFQDGKAGISLAATNLVLRRMVEVDPFGDDAELLA
jgi:hypothetical protein